MKFLIIALISVVTTSAFSATPAQDCLKVKNGLDRKYCLDKYLESVKETHTNDKKSWGAGLSAADKEARAASIEESIIVKKEYINLMNAEIALDEKQLETVKAFPVAAAAAAPVEAPKKKKKKGGFRIKL
jgi:hypothetical protein